MDARGAQVLFNGDKVVISDVVVLGAMLARREQEGSVFKRTAVLCRGAVSSTLAWKI